MNDSRAGLWPDHRDYLKARAVGDDAIEARGYFSAPTKAALERIGFTRAPAPALVIPMWGVAGDDIGDQVRPDKARTVDGRVRKFEVPYKWAPRLDVNPMVRAALADTTVPVWLTEGVPKGDSIVSAGGLGVALAGVWNFTGTALADLEYLLPKGRTVYIAFDSDVMLKQSVHAALDRLGTILRQRGADVAYVYLPHGPDLSKQGIDDYLAAGGTLDELVATCATSELRQFTWEQTEPEPEPEPPAKRTLAEVLEVVRRHLRVVSPKSVYVVLATHVANQLRGDPVWLGVVGGSSRGKSELVMALSRTRRVVAASEITGPAALLSGVSERDRARGATGGLLRKLGATGTIALKDFTTVLDMHRDARAQLMAAFREVYDGEWSRHLGVDGGITLTWRGKAGMVFGVTTAIDRAHAVMSTMGERFLLCRIEINDDLELLDVARKAIGHEDKSRREMAEAVAGLLDNLTIPDSFAPAGGRAYERLKRLARFVARARSPVSWSYNSQEIELVGDPEGPARLYKALDRLYAGLIVIGVPTVEALGYVIEVGFDTIPKGRALALDAVRAGHVSTTRVGQFCGIDTKTAEHRLNELVAHGVLTRRTATALDTQTTGTNIYSLSNWAVQDLDLIDFVGGNVSREGSGVYDCPPVDGSEQDIRADVGADTDTGGGSPDISSHDWEEF